MLRSALFTLLLFSFFAPLYAEEESSTQEESDKKNLKIELNEPLYKNGILSTTKGGTVKGEDFFLQAQNISYIRRQENGKSVHKIEADGDLFFLFKGKAYTGEKIEIDAEARKSRIYNGCTTVEPWFVGGKEIELESDGSGIIHEGYMTTSENERNEWSVESTEVHLSKGSKVKAKNVRFVFVRMPLLWLPSFSTDLKQENRTPFKYRFRWDGLGPRVGISYDLFKTKHFRSELLFDIIFRHGLGAGIATNYKSPTSDARFKTYNYAAEDFQNLFGEKKLDWPRYRFQGEYEDRYFNDKVNFDFTYDKLSDLAVRGDYPSVGFDSGRIMPTQATFSRKTDEWISSLNTKVRVNNFQTVKQQLPLFQFTPRPIKIFESGCTLDSKVSAGYLDYRYANKTHHVHDFHSSRLELSQNLYRNFLLPGLSLTPQAGYTLINYSNSPQRSDKLLAIGKVGAECHTRFIHPLTHGSDAIEPYVDYQYITFPTVKPKHHYIFDLEDGYYRVNMLRFGLKNFFMKETDSNFLQRVNADIYTRAFFNTPTIGRTFPRVYADASWKATPSTAYSVGSAWDTQRHNLDHLNVKSDITVSEDVAFSVEYRRRNAYSWRKLDLDNFNIDSFRSEHRLRHSELSDQRNTLLGKLFLRFSPDFSVELNSRYGFGRHHHHEPTHYQAYEIDTFTLIRGALVLKFSIQFRTGYKGVFKSGALKGMRPAWDFWLGLEQPRVTTAIRKIGQGNYDN